LVQTVLSPAIGGILDHFGFTPVCMMMALLPILGLAILEVCLRGERAISFEPLLIPVSPAP
jgi:hypothetical protein